MKASLIMVGLVGLSLSLSSQIHSTVLFDFETKHSEVSIETFGNHHLDGMSRNIIDNPLPNELNGSKKVLKYSRSTNARWDAGFSLTIPAEVIPEDTYEVCFDYYAHRPGHCKVSLGSDPQITSERYLEYGQQDQWQHLCQKITFSSNKYGDLIPFFKQLRNETILIYPDYGTWGLGEAHDYYIDNISLSYTSNEKEVLFQVNMRDYLENFSSVFVSGSFNGWSGESHPLSDDDKDGIWTANIFIEDDYIEYIYNVDSWSDSENFDPNLACVASTSNGNGGFYANRFMDLVDNIELPVACYNECHNCAPLHKLTWNLNMNEEVVSPDGVFLAGDKFGHGEYKMQDPDNDGIYSISLERKEGFTSHYTFINGLCPNGWSCKENLVGQACGDAENYYDRLIIPVYSARTMNACFGHCSSYGYCEEEELYQVTFTVDGSNDNSSARYFIAGNTINYWHSRTHELNETEQEGLYSITIQLPAGLHEYKFIRDREWEQLDPSDECTITDDSGTYTNRIVEVIDTDLDLEVVYFNHCPGFSSVKDEEEKTLQFNVFPTVVDEDLYVNLITATKNQKAILQIIDSNGKAVHIDRANSDGVQKIGVERLASGMYIVAIESEGQVITQRFIKS